MAGYSENGCLGKANSGKGSSEEDSNVNIAKRQHNLQGLAVSSLAAIRTERSDASHTTGLAGLLRKDWHRNQAESGRRAVSRSTGITGSTRLSAPPPS